MHFAIFLVCPSFPKTTFNCSSQSRVSKLAPTLEKNISGRESCQDRLRVEEPSTGSRKKVKQRQLVLRWRVERQSVLCTLIHTIFRLPLHTEFDFRFRYFIGNTQYDSSSCESHISQIFDFDQPRGLVIETQASSTCCMTCCASRNPGAH